VRRAKVRSSRRKHLRNQKNDRRRRISDCGSGGRWFESTQLYQISDWLDCNFHSSALRSKRGLMMGEALGKHKDVICPLVRDEGVAGSNPATPTNTWLNHKIDPAPISAPKRARTSWNAHVVR
jgi:hypothetical protein